MKKKWLFVYIRLSKRSNLCGIAGIWSSNEISRDRLASLRKASDAMAERGPDNCGELLLSNCWLAHRRLSIIDTTAKSNQPMVSKSYSLIFNGEIYNFADLRSQLIDAGEEFKTTGDTEVLLKGLAAYGIDFLEKVNGFFSLGFYDQEKDELILARDRYGIKPLYYSQQDNDVIFGSSLETITPYISQPEIDEESLSLYLGLSYIPYPKTILKNVKKLAPGHCLLVSKKEIRESEFYAINRERNSNETISKATKRVRRLVESSVERRMVADVPVGTFLSGGVDSSIITHLVSRLDKSTPSFSIGFPDHPFFDESQKAREIAEYLGIENHVVQVTDAEIESELGAILDSLQEPFADSSAVLVHLLSKYARKWVKVILSGDGADELFGGYNKHRALFRSARPSISNTLLKTSSPILDSLPESRNQKVLNKLRKAKRYSRGLRSNFNQRYIEWACFTPPFKVNKLLKNHSQPFPLHALNGHIESLREDDFNSVLHADFRLVLSNDMLTKVDLMSMNNGLEVRVPFLDHELVDYVFSLPEEYKLNKKSGKILLKKAFENDFPEGYFDSSKRGFEAPLTRWFKGPLKDSLEAYVGRDFIEEQGIFDSHEVQQLIRRVNGSSPGDSPFTLWAIYVFQHWYKRLGITKN
jgi:asparagine synthase (glutamine-hydrolysing)